ncbi:SURF1 family protein [Arthrobacter echini]|uniref:SURF1 family protein n=1 Tax=Arthrobacter echini TaxID=1529066 RepID=UPI0021CC782D|nr:SURF1 family protein [Arthrobacter echini]
MLKTAIKPRWILMLILAMAIASVFVLLSRWQFSSSSETAPPAPTTTEAVRPLTDVLDPLSPLYATGADQMVSFEGAFVPGARILVQDRLLDGDDGLWVVEGFAVEGPTGDEATATDAEAAVIPVVLGWVPSVEGAASVPEQTGAATVVGRLLPPEAPEVARPVEGQLPTLSTAALSNVWDQPVYAAFVVAAEMTRDGVPVPFAAGLEDVIVGPQPQETPVNWLNIFYAIEWVVFAGFAFFLWWRLVADDHRRSLEDAADAEEARVGGGGSHATAPVAATSGPELTSTTATSSTATSRTTTTRTTGPAGAPAPGPNDTESGTLP